MKQSNVKNKIHKNEKLWVIPLAAASVIAGATVTGSLNTTTVSAETTDTTTSSASSTPPVKTLTSIPTPANFYITINEKYVPYNAKGKAAVLPYSTNNMHAGDSLYGFYIILPKSITGNLKEFQQSASDYVAAIKQDSVNPVDSKYPGQGIVLNSLTVYQLSNTSDGRQVFYFRPDDDAHVDTPDINPNFSDLTKGGTTYNKRIKLSLPIQTGDKDASPSSITVNAGTDDEVATQDVLFMGIGDSNSNVAFYPSISSASLGITNAPDKNIAGISYTNSMGNTNVETVTYVAPKVKDTYNAYGRHKR